MNRPPLEDHRTLFHHEVYERGARRRDDGIAPDLAMRLAFEQAFIRRGYLRTVTGRQVLRE